MASYSQGKDGRWRVRYWLPKDPLSGKRKQQRSPRAFRTKKEAETWYAGERTRLDRQRGITPADMTLADYAELWFQGHAPKIREVTAFNYRRMLDQYILPELGGQVMSRLHAATIEAWHGRLAADEGLNPNTIHRLHGLLCQILRHATLRGTLAINPAAQCWPAKGERRRRKQPWTPLDVRRFLDVTDQPEDLIFRTAVLTGLRLGELLALEWPDLDLKHGTLSVRRTQTRDRDGRWTVGPPKTPRSERTVVLPSSLVRDLRAHRTRQWEARLAAPGWWPHELVFCYDDGRPFPRTSLRSRIHARCREAGVPEVSMHDLRRTATTWLVAMNVHPRAIQARLGHESVAMSMDVYADVANDVDRQLAAQIDAALNEPLDLDDADLMG